MNQHFAASWLQSLSGKLESLTEWSWASDKRGSCTTHRNLFREFFSPPFQKTLALVDEQKKEEFLQRIEKNLYKFEDRTQQFPLGCLCALLQHGKDSPKTQEKVVAWVDFLLERLHGGLSSEVVCEVVEECLSSPFQKFVPLMEESVKERLADGLGEHIGKLEEDARKMLLENLHIVPARIECVVTSCTQKLNEWLEEAPRFPATPIALADTLAMMEHPLVRFFTAIRDASKKESFLVAVALALQGLRTRFRWMCAVEPDLEALGVELQRRLFVVEGQGPVMEMWLSSRLKKYNAEVANRTADLIANDPARCEQLRARLQQLLPARLDGHANSGWMSLDSPTVLADHLLSWLAENSPGFFCPQHTLAKETLVSVLQRFGNHFEMDTNSSRARLGPLSLDGQPQVVAQAVAAIMDKPHFPPIPPNADTGQVLSPAPPPVHSLLPGTGSLSGQPARPLALTTPPPTFTPSGANAPEVDNLIDFLLKEALEGIPPDYRMRIFKMGHGVYRFGNKEVTLHTQNGRLYVYRVGEVVRHLSISAFLLEEGIQRSAVSATMASGAVDTSSVQRIALQSAQISAGVTTTTTPNLHQPQLPFGLSRPPEDKPSDPQALISKRVEAATKAMDVSKQIVRRSINFENERFLRKLVMKGMKHDKQWQAAYQEYCSSRGVADLDVKRQDKEFVATFIERNLANSINQEWAKKIMYSSADDDKKDKKDKKDRKKEKKDKKDKKRKLDQSSSADDKVAVVGSMPPMQMPLGLHMYPHGMPLGLGGMMGQMGQMGQIGQMGMVGMGPMGLSMLGDTCMPGMGMDLMDEPRPRKKQKSEKVEKDKLKKGEKDKDRDKIKEKEKEKEKWNKSKK